MRRDESAQMVRDYAAQVSPIFVSEFGSRVEQDFIRGMGQRMLDSADKYEVDEDTQAFELSDIDTMLIGLREELLDAVNYCAMIDELAARQGMAITDTARYRMRFLARGIMDNGVLLEMHRRNLPNAQEPSDYIVLLNKQTGKDHH